VHGAFEPATGQATIFTSSGRDSASHIQLVEKVMIEFPADRWLLIEDNLVIHTSREVRLALASRTEIQIQFLPKYACWLNLIEPWWKQLKSLALKGRRFEDLAQLNQALYEGLVYWNGHRHPYIWKKRPQEQSSVLGGIGVHLRNHNLAI
jgi:transposase